MRPLEYWAVFRSSTFFFAHVTLAYGNYNDMVLDASGLRGQSVAIWDFEWAYSSLPAFPCMLTAGIISLAHKTRSVRARNNQRICITTSPINTRVISLR